MTSAVLFRAEYPFLASGSSSVPSAHSIHALIKKTLSFVKDVSLVWSFR